MCQFIVGVMNRQPRYLELFFEKRWTVSPDGLMCNTLGFPLTYEFNNFTGEEFLSDSCDLPGPFSASALFNPTPQLPASDTTLNPLALELEQLRLKSLPQQSGLFRLTETTRPACRVGGGAAMLARMQAQKSSSGSIIGSSAARSAAAHSLFPPASIVEAPRATGSSASRVPTSNEHARRNAASNSHRHEAMDVDVVTDIPVHLDVDFNDDNDDDDDDDSVNNTAEHDTPADYRRPRICDIKPEWLQPIVMTACGIYRVLIMTRSAFPDPVERAAFRQESMSRAWQIHKMTGELGQWHSTLRIRRLLEQRGSQVRGEVKKSSRGIAPYAFNFNHLSPSQKLAKLVMLTSERTFQLHYERIDEMDGHGTGAKFSNPFLAEVLTQVMFKGGESSEGARYPEFLEPMSSNLISLLLVAMVAALNEHGSSQRIDIAFDESRYGGLFRRIKLTVEGYRTDYPQQFSDLTRDLLQNCRKAAGIPVDLAAESRVALTRSP
ncbi:hypothetical protein FRC12_024966 [Ceratobasidium sp. 428]|nr:hypothetical protein FRC12_024966 [Ceratobasidium sp. 428]